jgi:peptidyl-prolyl cis-trans isomerase SurA
MTNKHIRQPSQQPTARTRGLVFFLLLVPALQMQAQVLRPSGELRFAQPSATFSGPTGNVLQQQADYIVAVVNSEPVTNNDVRGKLLRAEQQLTQQGAVLPARAELVRQVLERVIGDKAQLQAAKASGMRIDDNAVNGAVDMVAQQNQISVEELRRRMAVDGIAYPAFREQLRDELMVSRFRQREVDARVAISDADIDQFLREQEGNNDLASMEINLAQILIAVPENASPEQVNALQIKAQQVADKARSGIDFITLVNEFSESSLRAGGGQMGLRNAERYPTLFLDATKNLRSGGIAGPIRSGAGFHVLKVIEKRQAGMPGINITQTRARHILLRATPQLNEAAAGQKLADLKRRAVAGQDFAVLAKENSDDGSAKDGGDLGWTNPGVFVPEFEQVMNSLAPGQISEPFVSRFGMHIIQVLERRESQLSTREQRELARGALREKKLDDAYVLWAQEIRGRAYVEYREPPQ